MTAYAREDEIAQVAGAQRLTLLRLRDPEAWPVALSSPAVDVWDALADGPCELGQVVLAVAARWEAPAADVADDVREVCRRLADGGFLVASRPDGTEARR